MASKSGDLRDKATVLQRSAAQIIDNLIISGIAIPLLIIALLISAGATAINETFGTGIWIISLAFIGLSSFVYQTALEYYWNGQTLGKKVLDIKVVKEDGNPLEKRDVLVRNVPAALLIVPYTGVILYPLAALTVAISENNQRIFDVAAETFVDQV